MKNIIVGILSLIIIYAMLNTFIEGPAFQGGEAGKIIEDFKDAKAPLIKENPSQKDSKDDDKLKALKDKAGSASSFAVSKNYKSKCASCHGVNGKGILGPDLFGKTSDEIYTSLIDYKMGRRENPVMKGLLINLDKSLLKELADEIGTFKTKANK